MTKKTLQNTGLTIVSLLVTLVLAEGVYALFHGDHMDTSLTSKAYYLVTEDSRAEVSAVS